MWFLVFLPFKIIFDLYADLGELIIFVILAPFRLLKRVVTFILPRKISSPSLQKKHSYFYTSPSEKNAHSIFKKDISALSILDASFAHPRLWFKKEKPSSLTSSNPLHFHTHEFPRFHAGHHFICDKKRSFISYLVSHAASRISQTLQKEIPLPKITLPKFPKKQIQTLSGSLSYITKPLIVPIYLPKPKLNIPRIIFPKPQFPKITLPKFSLLQNVLLRVRRILSFYFKKSSEQQERQPQRFFFFRKQQTTQVLLLLLVVGTVGVFFGVFASTTNRTKGITYQGRLLDTNYVPVADTTYNMKFRIFDAATNGTCKWGTGAGSNSTNCSNPGALSVTVSRGLFSVNLGDGSSGNNAFPYDFSDTTPYLEITINNETTTPRRLLTAAPYALNSEELGGIAASGFAQLSPGTSAQTLTSSATSTTSFTIATASLTSGSAFTVTGPSGGTAGITGSLVSVSSNFGDTNIGGTITNGVISSSATINSSTANANGVNLFLSTTNSNSTNQNGVYGIYNTLSDAIALNNTDFGLYTTVSNSGAITSGTKTIYGEYINAAASAANGGNTNAYGLYVLGKIFNLGSDAGTHNYYGLYVANDSSGTQTGGTSTKYGLYVEAPTGADTNYAAIFAGGNVGIGTTTPGVALDITSGNDYTLTTERSSSASNSIARGLMVRHKTSDDMLDGFGAALTFSIQDTAGVSNPIADIGAVRAGADTTGDIVFRPYTTGSAAEKMRIMANGNVGIGTTTPSYKLDIQQTAGSASDGVRLIGNTNGNPANLYLGVITNESTARNWLITANNDNWGDFGIKSSNANAGDPYSAGTTRLVINNSGNIGIGTTSPTANFQVAQSTTGVGTISATAASSTVTGSGTIFTNTFKVGDTLTSNGETRTISAIASNTSMTTDAWTNTTSSATYTLTGGTRFSVLGNGNVGIGVVGPLGKLQIGTLTSGSGEPTYHGNLILQGNPGSSNAAGGIEFKHSATSNGYGWKIASVNDSNDGLIFSARSNSATWSDRMYITNAGNVGIGTTAPGVQTFGGQQYLTIKGSTTGGVLELTTAAADADTADNGAIFFSNPNISSGDKRIAYIESRQSGTTTGSRGGVMNFFTRADNSALANRLTILQSGNVGIGTTTPQTLLHLYNTSSRGLGIMFGNGSYSTTKDLSLLGVNNSANDWAATSSASDLIFMSKAGQALGFAISPTSTVSQYVAMTLTPNAHIEYSATTTPPISSCGTGATITGTDMAGRAVVGTSPGTTCTVTFVNSWTNPPLCWANNETSAQLARASSTISALTISGTLTANDNLTYGCVGWK